MKPQWKKTLLYPSAQQNFRQVELLIPRKDKYFLKYSGNHWPCSATFHQVPRAQISREFRFLTPQRRWELSEPHSELNWSPHVSFPSGLWLLRTRAENCCPTQELSKVIVLHKSSREAWNNMVTTWRPSNRTCLMRPKPATCVYAWKSRQQKFVRKTKMCIRGLLVTIYDTNPCVKGSCQVTKSSETWGYRGGSQGEDGGRIQHLGNVDLCEASSSTDFKSKVWLGYSHSWQWLWCLRKWKSKTQEVGGPGGSVWVSHPLRPLLLTPTMPVQMSRNLFSS